MIYRTLLPFFLLTVSLTAVPVFIGTNTLRNKESRGIYLMDFDPVSGKLTEPVLAGEYQNPGFLALHPTKSILYACGLPNQPFSDNTSSIAAFGIGSDFKLKFLAEASGGGKNACHLAVDAAGSTVAVANYEDGRIATVQLNEEGIPGSIVSLIANEGSSVNKSRQEGPHAHGVYFDKANAHLLVPDLGLDQVLVYPFDAATSKLGAPRPALAATPGAGPRHLAFSPDERHVYVINELNNTVLPASFEGGKLEPLATVPTLPAGFEGNTTTSEIEVHPNGRFVYGSNRGHNSIVVYQRDSVSGLLTLIQHVACGGGVPRHFKIDPSGKWLICANQESNSISVFSLDEGTGLLGEASNTVSVPAPICLLFGRK
jgi:6-phosphogluconolactonase